MRLLDGTALLPRGPGALRVGFDRERGVEFTGLDESEIAALRSSARAEPGLLPAHLALRLRAAGLLVDPAARTRLALRVEGFDPVSFAVVDMLVDALDLSLEVRTPARVGRDLAALLGADSFGSPIPRVLAQRLARRASSLRLVELARPDLVLIAGSYAPEPGALGTLVVEDLPHLPVLAVERGYELGPLVVPGRGPCWSCLTRARAESDPFDALDRSKAAAGTQSPPSALARTSAALEIARMLMEFAHHRAGDDRASSRRSAEDGEPGIEHAPHRATAPGGDPLSGIGELLRIDEFGAVARTRVRAHASCGCGADALLTSTLGA